MIRRSRRAAPASACRVDALGLLIAPDCILRPLPIDAVRARGADIVASTDERLLELSDAVAPVSDAEIHMVSLL